MESTHLQPVDSSHGFLRTLRSPGAAMPALNSSHLTTPLTHLQQKSERQADTIDMANINERKRAAQRRRVQAALQQILNDTGVMPNADCPDLVVSVSRVEFGRTVREIYIDVK